MTKWLVGPSTHVGDPARLARRVDLLEVRSDAPIPRPAKLRAWREAVGPRFVFSVVLPRVVADLTRGAEAEKALEAALDMARVLEARVVLLQTSSNVRPTAANRTRIGQIAERAGEGSHLVAWEASGLWELDEIRATAKAAGCLPVVDASQVDPMPGAVVYTRLRGLGGSSQLSSRAMEAVATRLSGRREVFVAVEQAGGAARLKQFLEQFEAESRTGSAGGIVLRPVPGRLRAEDEEQ